MSQRIIRDDIKAGNFLNRRIKGSPTDYKQGRSYYIGEPIQLAFSFFEWGRLEHGWQAEFAIAGARDFAFSRSVFRNVLAIFFKDAKMNNIRLQALISPENKQALRLAHLAGMTLEGRLRKVTKDGDKFIFSILKEEFEKLYGGSPF